MIQCRPFDPARRSQNVQTPGAGLRPATYTPNSLNQYTSRTVPNAADILGTADAAATVTVNSQATYRMSTYYHKALTLDNSAKAIFPVVKVSTVYGGNSSNVYGKVFLPKTPEAYSYDLDGNLTSDGRWNYVWDGENRLIKMESLTNTPPVFRQRLEFEYDWQGRRIKKKVTNLGTWAVTQTKFLYDGWNIVAELNATNNAVIRSYMWGLDLSGTPQGVGGVGGLLAVNDAANGVHFVAYDGNGNVAALVKATDGTVSAQYEYGPFAEPIRVTGLMGKVNPIRFSTKYTDDESGFLYYGLRFYDPFTGRWLSRDPIEEDGGSNLYTFCGNESIDVYDPLGLEWVIKGYGKARALAFSTSSKDTFGDLGRKLSLDTSDYQQWAQTTDKIPIPCKCYSVPNIIYIDKGVLEYFDTWPTSVFSVWDRAMRSAAAQWENKGYSVVWTDYVIGSTIRAHLGDPDLYGYVYMGHGAPGAIIGLEEPGGTGETESSALFPGRYTHHGIAFMQLKACYSAERVFAAGRHAKYTRNHGNQMLHVAAIL